MDAHEAIEVYQPRSIDPEQWARIRPTVLAWVRRTLPCSASAAVQRMRITGNYVIWSLGRDLPLDAEVILTENRIEGYFQSGAVTAAAKGTYRSHLRTVARANTRRAVWTPTPQPMRRTDLRDPYTGEEVATFFRLVDVQPTPRRRRVLDALLHLGLGMGLSAGEMHSLRVADFTRTDDLVLVHLADRIVPALQGYADGVWRVVNATEGERIFGDHLGAHRRFYRLVESLEVPAYAPSLRTQRLRTTWLVSVLGLRELTLAEFRKVSGLTSGRALDDLVRYLPVDGENYLRRAAGR